MCYIFPILWQVIEAVYEDMGIKKDVFSKLDKVCKPEAFLWSNTSYLNIDEVSLNNGLNNYCCTCYTGTCIWIGQSIVSVIVGVSSYKVLQS